MTHNLSPRNQEIIELALKSALQECLTDDLDPGSLLANDRVFRVADHYGVRLDAFEAELGE